MSANNAGLSVSVSSLKAMFEERIQKLQSENVYQLPVRQEPEPEEIPEKNLPTQSYKEEIKPWIKQELYFLKRKLLQLNRELGKRNRYLERMRAEARIPTTESKAEELASSYLNELDKIEYMLNEMKDLLYSINSHETHVKSVLSDTMTAATFIKQRMRLNEQYNDKKNILQEKIENSVSILKQTRDEIRRELESKWTEYPELFAKIAKAKEERIARKEAPSAPPSSLSDALPPIEIDIASTEDDEPPVYSAEDEVLFELPDDEPPTDIPEDEPPTDTPEDGPPTDVPEDEPPTIDTSNDSGNDLPIEDNHGIDHENLNEIHDENEDIVPHDSDEKVDPSKKSALDDTLAPAEEIDESAPEIPDSSSEEDIPIFLNRSSEDEPPEDIDRTEDSGDDLPFIHDGDSSSDDDFEPPKEFHSSEFDEDGTPRTPSDDFVRHNAGLLQKYKLSPSVIHTSKLKKVNIDISQNPLIKPLMKIIFVVKKYGRNSNLKRKRVLEIDWLSGYIQTWHGTKKKLRYAVNRIEKIEKDVTFPKLIRIYFAETPNEKSRVSEYYFQSKFKRERFYESIKSILNMQLCCPNVIPEEGENIDTCIVDISGSFRFKSLDGEVGKAMGERSFVITSSPIENILLYCCTFAIGIAPEEPRDLRAFIPFNKCDIYCISFQDDRTAWDSRGENGFLNYAKELIGREYMLVSFHQSLSGMSKLVIFARKRHIPKITNVKTETVVLSKSSASLLCSITFNESHLLFINSNMPDTQEGKVKLYEQTCSAKLSEKTIPNLSHYHQIIWMGDLKFTINLDESTLTKLSLNKDHVPELLNADSLRQAITQDDPIFCGFQEAPISFLPTSINPPAYSDRILWRSNFPNRISCEVYESYIDSNNDHHTHHPVYSIFNLSIERTFASLFCPHPICTVRLEHLSSFLTKGSVSKPFFMLCAPWLESPVLSPKLEKSSTPVWNIGLPILGTITNHAVYMNQQCLQIVLYDGKTLVGASFATLLELKGGETVSFPLLSPKGRDLGVIKLRVKVVFS